MPDTKLILRVRATTGAGIVDCQKALEETQWDYDKAIELLRKRGQKVAATKQDRETREGIVHAYTHANGRVGALVEVLCETDFVARNEDFKNFVHDLSLQIVATNPLYLRPEDIPSDVIEKEKEIYREQIAGEKKPDDIKEKIIVGKLAKYYQEVCLLKQLYIKDDSITIEQLLGQMVSKVGENIQVRRFSRFAL